MMRVADTPHILLAGATGMVGSRCLRGWLDDPAWDGQLLVPARRLPERSDPRLFTLLSDLTDGENDAALREALHAKLAGARLDVFVSCLGTTLRAAGSREAFIAVDRELVLRLAKLAQQLGARHAVLVSSVGASRQSANFYLRVKGETEDELAALGFDRVDILRPGLLLGPRAERRPGEALARALSPIYNPLLRGRLARYRAVQASAVAAAICALAKQSEPGRFVHETDEIERLSA